MAVKLRLRRDGQKKRPFYHLVAADERRARNGRYIEELGYYNPIVAVEKEPVLVLKEDRIRYWLSVGAQPSETVAGLLKSREILPRQPKKEKPAEPVSEEVASAEAETAPTEEATRDATPENGADGEPAPNETA